MEFLDELLAEKALEVLRSSGVSNLERLVALFQSKGLGRRVASWIGMGEDVPITSEQIREVFGADLVQHFAWHLVTSAREAPSLIAKLLPIIVEKLKRDDCPTQTDLLRQTGIQLASNF